MKLFACLALAAVTPAGAGEVWVVTSSTKAVKVVDTTSESVIGTIPLTQNGSAPQPRGIAFSTVDGMAGDFAFVGQGTVLHVLDARTKTLVRSVALDAVLGTPVEIVDLDPSPNREFSTGGNKVVRAYLVVLSEARRATGAPLEPYWIVLDQRALVHSPPPVPVVVASSFLHDAATPELERGRAAGVAVMGSAGGGAHFRAWLTTRVPGSPERMRATRLEKSAELDAPWLVGRSEERVLPAGRSAPGGFTVAVAHDAEAQIFPVGASGALIDLGQGGSCSLAQVNLGPVAVRGPGAGGYEIVAVDLDGPNLVRVNESSCAYDLTPLGSGPVDLTVDALFGHGAAWVANRASDDLSVVRLNGSTATIALGPPPKGACVECPVSIEARPDAGRACTTALRLAKLPDGARLEWDGVGCTGVEFPVFCQCDPGFDLDCACACDPATDSNCFGSFPIAGQPGVQLGTPGSRGPLTHQFAGAVPFPPGPCPCPPEPVILLGAAPSRMYHDDSGGGKVWVGTSSAPD